jgi:isochorismate synthase
MTSSIVDAGAGSGAAGDGSSSREAQRAAARAPSVKKAGKGTSVPSDVAFRALVARARLVCLSREVPVMEPERFLDPACLPVGAEGARGLWDTRGLGDADATATWGTSLRVDVPAGDAGLRGAGAGAGEVGLAAAGREVRAVLQRALQEDPDAPLRAFVAVPFDATQGASLRVPKFTYRTEGSTARLLIVGPERRRAQLVQQLDEVAARIEASGNAGRSVEETELALPKVALLDSGRDGYRSLVDRALAAIDRGLLEKVVTARRVELLCSSPPDLLALLARLPRARVARFLVEREGEAVLGATPETLVRLAGGVAHADALAGTRPLAADEATNEAIAGELLAATKDRHEHDLVVRHLRDGFAGLSPDSRAGSNDRTDHAEVFVGAMRVLRLATVMHLYTPLTTRVPTGTTILDLVAALHTTPAVLGVPSEPAARWLRANEGFSRGLYAGSLGTLDARGEGSFVVAIRSARLAGERATLYAGGGIVRGSDREAELLETEAKLAPMAALFGASALRDAAHL